MLYLALPPHYDQFTLSYMGWRVLEGAPLYRDLIAADWPGTIWMHAASTALFGHALWSWHAVDFALMGMAAWFLSKILREAEAGPAWRIALLLYPPFYVTSMIPGQHDMVATHFLCGVVWFHARAYATERYTYQIVTGIFLALAVLCKPTLAIVGVLLAVQPIILGLPLRRVLTYTAAAAVACLLVCALAVVILVSLGSPLHDVIECTITANMTTQFSWMKSWSHLSNIALMVHFRWWVTLTAGAAVGGYWTLKRNRAIGTTGLMCLWLAGICSYLIQRKAFVYHMSPCFPALLGLLAVALGRVYTDRVIQAYGRWTLLIQAACVALVVVGVAKKVHSQFAGLPGAVLSGKYDQYLSRFSENSLTVAQAAELARRIERSVPPGETVYVLGDNDSLSFLSARPQPVALFYIDLLLKTRPPIPFADRWLDRWERELRQRTPVWCLIHGNIEQTWLKQDERAPRWLRMLLAEKYRRVGPFGTGEIYTLYQRR
jgi:hypothetical protein